MVRLDDMPVDKLLLAAKRQAEIEKSQFHQDAYDTIQELVYRLENVGPQFAAEAEAGGGRVPDPLKLREKLREADRVPHLQRMLAESRAREQELWDQLKTFERPQAEGGGVPERTAEATALMNELKSAADDADHALAEVDTIVASLETSARAKALKTQLSHALSRVRAERKGFSAAREKLHRAVGGSPPAEGQSASSGDADRAEVEPPEGDFEKELPEPASAERPKPGEELPAVEGTAPDEELRDQGRPAGRATEAEGDEHGPDENI